MTPAELSSRWQRCQRALAASQDGFWERNLRTQAVWYSPGFLKLFGFAEGDLPSARGAATARVHPEDQARFKAAYREALRCNGSFDYEVRFRDAAGHWRWVHGSGRVWPDDAGQAEYISGAVADVHRKTTALHSLEQHRRELEALVSERTAGLEAALALAEQRRLEAERANAAKSRFLAHMSHEIRTPLNGVLGLTELALRGAESAEQRRYLAVAQQSGQALLQVISDVLDFSRIEAGRFELRQQPFDLCEALAETLRAVMPLAQQRDLLLMFDWDGDTDPVLGDETGIRQIITNLLGNAIKFTGQGQVALSAEARRVTGQQLAVAVQVSDSGPGIPDALRQRVFEAFEQGDDSLARQHGGTGLGLSIARRLAQAMGGTLQLDSPAAGGTVFTLSLQLPLAGPVPSLPPATPGHAWLVYHRQAAGEWLARRMRRLGWTVEVLIGLPEAMARARREDLPAPDVVLLAEPTLLPGIDLGALRAMLPATPVHLLIRPDWHDPRLEQHAAALQITPILAPLTPTTLRQLGAPPVPPAGAAPALADDAPLLRADAEVLLVEDNPVNQLVGQEYLRALGLQVRLATNGDEALAACASRAPALVLMDLQMPGMDGLEATARLQAMQRDGLWPGAPILALTAHASDADRAACHAAGMGAVLTKPLTLDSLRQQLMPWLAG